MIIASLEAALASHDNEAVDVALAAYADDPVALVDAITHVIDVLQSRGLSQAVETRWQFRLAEALETSAARPATPRPLAARYALRAAQLQRDTLNDGEGTTRTLVLALMLSAEDEHALREVVDVSGGPEPALTLLEKAAKRSKGDDERVGRLRRALARLHELVFKDKDRAFVEAMKAGRKLPSDGVYVDDVYRLAVETGRLDEAAAFFLAVAEDGRLTARTRATAYNKLGATHETQGERERALAAFTQSLLLHETRAARRKAERLQEALEVATPLPPPVAGSSTDTNTARAVASLTVVAPAPSPTADTEERSGRVRRKSKAKRSRRGHSAVDDAEQTAPMQSARPSPDAPTLSEPPRIGASENDASRGQEDAEGGADLGAVSMRGEVVARAQEFLRRSDGAAGPAELVACAEALAAILPTDPRVLLLLRRAMMRSAPSGGLPGEAVALLRRDATLHGTHVVTLLIDVRDALPADCRDDYAELWLAGSHAAGLDVDAGYGLLADSAVRDAPGGPCFLRLDGILRSVGDVDRRDAVLREAWEHAAAAGDGPRRLRLLECRIAVLLEARRDGAAASAWMELALDERASREERAQARRFVESKATTHDRAMFLSQLAEKVGGDEAVDVLHELLGVQGAVDDKHGGEATARALLRLRNNDAVAQEFLLAALEHDPARSDEVIVLLRAQADHAVAVADIDGARVALERLARVHKAREHSAEAAAVLIEAVRLSPGDRELIERVCESLLGLDRVREVVELLDQLAEDAPLGVAARLWVRAADLARHRLHRLELARQLLDKSVAADDTAVAAFSAHADLALELGDVPAALASLTRLLSLESEPPARAVIELRIGSLLESHFRQDDKAIARYRASIEADRTLRPAWDALYALARRIGDVATVVDALTGIAMLDTGHQRAITLVKLARVHEHERGDVVAATTAYENAVATWPAELDALQGLVALKARAVVGRGDVEAAIATPAPELVDDLTPHLIAAEEAGAVLPFELRRLLALGLTQRGDLEEAGARFEALLAERVDDLSMLLAFSRHLLRVAHQPLSEGAAAADERRRHILETVLHHHAYALKPDVHVDIWGDVCALRLQHGDLVGAKKAAKKALSLIAGASATWGLEDVVSDRAARAFVLSLEDSIAPARADRQAPDANDLQQLEQALMLDLSRAIAPSEKARLKEKQARLALVARSDAAMARQLFQEALRHDPDLSTAREALFDLELSGEDPREALERSRTLVATEPDPHRRALLHLRLFRLHLKLNGKGGSVDAATAEIKLASELDPRDPEIAEAAEQFFRERKDPRSLDALWSAQLKGLERHDVAGRTAVLDRLAQLRRYELKDTAGAIDACEAWSALDPSAIKPREDAARWWCALSQWSEAQAAWLAVLERDVLVVEAWRGLFGVLARNRHGDEAFAVAATMVGLGLADDDTVRAVRTVRPPFPRWPVVSGDVYAVRRRLGHPVERTAIRAILELVAPRLMTRFGRPLEDFSVKSVDAIAESRVPPSVVAAIRTAATLAGVVVPRGGAVPLFVSPARVDDEVAPPPFAALPASQPALMIHPDVVRGGMTPERAFALGRAMAWLSPWAVLATSIDDVALRRMLEGLVAGFLSPRNVERPSGELEHFGAELRREVLAGLSPTDAAALEQALLPALRDWTIVRSRMQIADWKAAISLTGDRLGFLLAGDLTAALKVIRGAGAPLPATRHSLRELVLFSISPPYAQLRRDLALAVSDQALAPIFDLG